MPPKPSKPRVRTDQWAGASDLLRGTKHLQVRVHPETIEEIDRLAAKHGKKGAVLDALVDLGRAHPEELDEAIRARMKKDEKKP